MYLHGVCGICMGYGKSMYLVYGDVPLRHHRACHVDTFENERQLVT